MDPPHKFAYLSLDRIWPQSEQLFWQSQAASFAPTSDVILLCCLLQLRLFRECAESAIRDVRIPETDKEQRDFLCRDRDRLIRNIAMALAVFDEIMVKRETNEEAWLDVHLRGMQEARSYQDAFQRWFKEGPRWNTRIARQDRVRAQTVLRAIGIVEGLYLRWDTYVLSSPGYIIGARKSLVERLDTELRQYGPSEALRPRYSDRARYTAIYSVLEAFGLGKPDDATNGSRRVEYILKEKSSSPQNT